MVDNNDQIPVTALVGDLIDPDPPQTRKTIHCCFDIVVDSGDELFDDIHRATIEAAFKDITNLLKAKQPYAVCDWCDGDGCEHCKSKGWMGKFAWDMTPRREQ